MEGGGSSQGLDLWVAAGGWVWARTHRGGLTAWGTQQLVESGFGFVGRTLEGGTGTPTTHSFYFSQPKTRRAKGGCSKNIHPSAPPSYHQPWNRQGPLQRRASLCLSPSSFRLRLAPSTHIGPPRLAASLLDCLKHARERRRGFFWTWSLFLWPVLLRHNVAQVAAPLVNPLYLARGGPVSSLPLIINSITVLASRRSPQQV